MKEGRRESPNRGIDGFYFFYFFEIKNEKKKFGRKEMRKGVWQCSVEEEEEVEMEKKRRKK